MLAAVFSISVAEAGIVAVLTLVAAVAFRWTGRPWLLGVPMMFLATSLATPADPASTLLTGIPVAVIHVAALVWTERRLLRS